MSAASGFKAYLTVTAAYWAFMLTDGALRMLVLLHFHTLGFTPVQLAYLFLLYEVMGIVTNLSAGWLASRFGLTSTLYAGLAIQIGALLALAALDPAWGLTASVLYVMAVQGASGVAKDLSKMSSKSAVKLLAPSEGGSLFRWVAALTGSKNAVKGLGFFIGAVMLGLTGFQSAVLFMATVLGVILLATLLFMPAGLPGGKKGTKMAAVWPKDPDIRALSLARVFLFGARDTWFVVGIPVFFYAVLSDGTVEGNRAAFFMIGSFMAGWIIFYGAVQGFAPKLLANQTGDVAQTVASAILGGGADRDTGTIGDCSGGRFARAGAHCHCRAPGLCGGVRFELRAALLSDPGLLDLRAGDARCRVLLHGQRCGPFDRHADVRALLPTGRRGRVPCHGRRDVGAELARRRASG